jgi:NMD protein affecting ribosome stability and mRNA decay
VICATCGTPNRDEARFCDSCGAPLSKQVSEQRKVVTVLFCAVSGSTEMGEALDREVLRATGRSDDAQATLSAAIDQAHAKGSSVLEAQIRRLLEQQTAETAGTQPA